MKKCWMLAAVLAMPSVVAKAEADWLVRYNVAWETPSQDSLDSMPLSGRRGAGANVWVQDGSIWLYLAHNGAYDEQGRLLKLGCLRVTPVGMNLGSGSGFRQELDLATGGIRVTQGGFETLLWFAGETLIIESRSAAACLLDVAFGTWRDQPRKGIRQDMMGARGDYTPDQVTADTEGFAWFHRNSDHPGDVVGKAKGQGVAAEAVYDATTRRVFGGAVAVDGGLSQPVESLAAWQFWEGNAWSGRSEASSKHMIAVRLAGALDADPRRWRAEARALLAPAAREAAKADESQRWTEFWNRSHVIVNPSAKPDDSGWLIGRNYQLFRYMLACNRDGELPLLFNGGIFTTDNNGRIKGNNNDELPTFEGKPACRKTSDGSAGRRWPAAMRISWLPRRRSTSTVPLRPPPGRRPTARRAWSIPSRWTSGVCAAWRRVRTDCVEPSISPITSR
jgi:hypothetical protein